MKVIIVLPDGVGVRNYLYTGLLGKLVHAHDVSIISPIATDTQAVKDIISEVGIEVPFYRLPDFFEQVAVKLFREAGTYGRLLRYRRETDNPALMEYWRSKRPSFVLSLFFRLAQLIGKSASKYPKMVNYFDRWLLFFLRKGRTYKECKNLLLRKKPDVLFSTHQRAINAVPLFIAAQDLGIRTVSAIYSWDNLPKARLLVKADEYVVWSDYMKEELEFYYPEEKHKPIHVTGTPQFEFYHDEKNYSTREEFCAEHDLDPERPIICYSGGDTLTSPYDQCYVADLAEAINNMPANDRPQLLLRRCPVDFSKRYDAVLSKYADVVRVSVPKWRQGDPSTWTLTYPMYDDVKLLVDTVRHCDAVYNVGSTMAHDFCTHNKPAIYANYDPSEAVGSGWSTKIIYQLPHFRSMPSLDCVEWVNSKEEIQSVLERVLKDPLKNSEKSIAWFHKIVGDSSELASERIAKVVVGEL